MKGTWPVRAHATGGRHFRGDSIDQNLDTYDQLLNHEHEFAPDVDKLTMDASAPLQAGSDGKYPVPMPGITKRREY
jgi:hypothetical protein